MALLKNELREWKSLSAKSKKYKIPIKRIGAAGVSFGGGTHAQLGTGSATIIMDARIRLKTRRKIRKKRASMWDV